MHARRRPFALLPALALMSACTSFQQVDTVPAIGEEIRVEANGTPLGLSVRATDGRPTLQVCSAQLVDGRLSMVIGDTLIFGSLTRVDPTRPSDDLCHTEGAARLVLTDPQAAIISTPRTDVRRTVGASLLLAAALAMFVTGG